MRLFHCLSAACFGFVALASARSGYLGTVGPSPLRSQPPPPAARAQGLPLPSAQPAPAVSVSPEKLTTTGVTLVSSSPASGVTGAATNTSETAVTPEMFVETFRQRMRDGQARETAVVLPPNFVPPASSAEKPSSTATYESP